MDTLEKDNQITIFHSDNVNGDVLVKLPVQYSVEVHSMLNVEIGNLVLSSEDKREGISEPLFSGAEVIFNRYFAGKSPVSEIQLFDENRDMVLSLDISNQDTLNALRAKLDGVYGLNAFRDKYIITDGTLESWRAAFPGAVISDKPLPRVAQQTDAVLPDVEDGVILPPDSHCVPLPPKQRDGLWRC